MLLMRDIACKGSTERKATVSPLKKKSSIQPSSL